MQKLQLRIEHYKQFCPFWLGVKFDGHYPQYSGEKQEMQSVISHVIFDTISKNEEDSNFILLFYSLIFSQLPSLLTIYPS